MQIVGLSTWRNYCSLQCCIRICVCLSWSWSFFPAHGPWASPLPWPAWRQILVLQEWSGISAHIQILFHSSTVVTCAPVPTQAQPHKTLKMWHFWAPHKEHGNEAPNSHPPERMDTFSQKYLACRCLAVWWIALIFYREQTLFFVEKIWSQNPTFLLRNRWRWKIFNL